VPAPKLQLCNLQISKLAWSSWRWWRNICPQKHSKLQWKHYFCKQLSWLLQWRKYCSVPGSHFSCNRKTLQL